MHTEQVIKRLKELEMVQDEGSILILFPNDDGTYTAEDQYHKGKIYTEEEKNKHGGTVIIWD